MKCSAFSRKIYSLSFGKDIRQNISDMTFGTDIINSPAFFGKHKRIYIIDMIFDMIFDMILTVLPTYENKTSPKC